MVLTHTHLFGNFAIGWDETLRNTQKASMWASPPEFIFFMVSFLLEKHIRPKTIGLHIYPEDGLVGDDLNKHGGGTTGNPTRLLSVPFFFLEKQHPSSCRENSLGISWSLTPLTLPLYK